ncbi:MAG: hypothetical protein LUD39_02145 [Opitutae bacterium]|nr:hypothetical protein [Opitutae bacterium]
MSAGNSGGNELGVVGGWGIAPAALAKFFPAGAIVVAPTRENVARVASLRRVVAYSLGAWLLLDAAARGEFSCDNAVLYAPFLAFSREKGRGGKIFSAQVKFLRRWLRRDCCGALADFYARAGLSLSPPAELPYAPEDLEAGLDFLLDGDISAVPAAATNWEIVLGENDALLDAEIVAATFPKNPTRIIPRGTHDLLTLI